MAVIGAFVLIALAIFIRGQLVDDDGGGSKGDEQGEDGSAPVVACTPDLVAVCDALAADGAIAASPPTLDLPDAAEPPTDIDGWITWSPAPQIANFTVQPDKVWATPRVLGWAVDAVLIDPSSASELPAPCRAQPTWACLADAAPGLSVGVGDPSTSEGIARLAPFAQTFATDDDYTTLDADGLDDLVTSPPDGQADAAEMAARLTTRPGSLSMTSGPNDLLVAQTRTSQGEQRGLRVLTPAPRTRLVVVLAPRVGRSDALDDLDCAADPPDALVDPLDELGIQACEGSADDALAGFLFQVQKKVG